MYPKSDNDWVPACVCNRFALLCVLHILTLHPSPLFFTPFPFFIESGLSVIKVWAGCGSGHRPCCQLGHQCGRHGLQYRQPGDQSNGQEDWQRNCPCPSVRLQSPATRQWSRETQRPKIDMFQVSIFNSKNQKSKNEWRHGWILVCFFFLVKAFVHVTDH